MIKHKNRIIIVLLITAVLLLAGGFAAVQKMTGFIRTPMNPGAAQLLFSITPGLGLEQIAERLEKKAIISSSRLFTMFVRFKKAGKNLQAGEYLLSGAQSPEQILEILLKGKVKLHKLTIPEGLNMKETGKLVEAFNACSQTEFLSLCDDPSFIQSLGVKATSLEGYLFPDTYFFPKNTSCKKMMTTMFRHFQRNFPLKWEQRAHEMGFSTHEIVTLASIIEKETGDASERPVISSVFHNRLKKKMRLESDPTVIYGIKNFDGNIKRKHLRMRTPYNTYKIRGLPPGPIANPGKLSIQAALYPEKTEYLFFVSKKDTTHYFSKTIQEHNRAVRKYQLNRK